jgi:oxygen-dependent protoporphyrinogen oxidase
MVPGVSVAMAARYATRWIGGRAKPREEDTVAAWSDRALGRAATSWLVGPALQGIYGVRPEALAARAIFSGERRARGRRMAAPEGGMGRFIAALRDRLHERGVEFSFGHALERLEPGVPTVLATNAPAAAVLLRAVDPVLADVVGGIEMTTMTSVTAFYAPAPRDLSGFGMLFPRQAGINALGVLFNADIFPSASTVRSETWIYGGDGTVAEPPALVTDRLRADRARVTGTDAVPLAIHATRHAPALPVYGRSVLRAHDRLEHLPPWLVIAGNYTGRLGVARLLEGAEAAAGRLIAGAESSRGAE